MLLLYWADRWLLFANSRQRPYRQQLLQSAGRLLLLLGAHI